MANSLCSGELPAFSEESTWASYIQDFVSMQQMEGIPSFSSNDGYPLVVSDAASCVQWNSQAHANPSRDHWKLSRRRKGRENLDDDDYALEDTASSPMSSPKINCSNHMELSERKKEGTSKNPQSVELKRSRIADMKLSENIYDCTELRKRGLCLVPLSVLIDYIK